MIFVPAMYFLLEKWNMQAIAHPSTCPEIPVDRLYHERGRWQHFDSAPAISAALADLKTWGYDAHWCRCQICRVIRVDPEKVLSQRVAGAESGQCRWAAPGTWRTIIFPGARVVSRALEQQG